jgi:hypothetical protein
MIHFSKYISASLILLGSLGTVHAQESDKPYKDYRSRIVRNVKLDALLDTVEARQRANPVMRGYRIQVYMGSERKAALDVKSELQKNFPHVETYIIYQQPYFKVRVGDFRNQAGAQELYYELLSHFQKAFIVHDEINIPKLH